MQATSEIPPLELFQPSSGTTPPEFAGRDNELKRVAAKITAPLEIGNPPTNAILLHGARGVGKTCLIEEITSGLHDSDTDVLELERKDFKSPELLTKAILQNAEDKGRLRFAGIRAEAGLRDGATPMVALGAEFRESEKPVPVHSPTRAMELATQPLQEGERRKGLLLVLDEIHTFTSEAEKETLQGFLGAIQRAAGKSKRWPVGLIMAGTPDTYGHLKSINATFVERMVGMGTKGGNMPLGCLDENGVKRALGGPLQAHGKFIADDVMTMAMDETCGYPYFVQMMGDALCITLNENDHRSEVITMQDVAPALESFRMDKHEFYTERIDEFEAAGVLEAALLVINAMRSAGGVGLKRQKIKSLCGDGLDLRDASDWSKRLSRSGWADTSEAALDSILHSGLIWGEKGAASAKFHFATPSLGGHAIEYAAGNDMKHLRELAFGVGEHP